ncbi:hypothetical protein U9M48_035685 [Paspalum notatum var. saurae]|uniref:Integrase catalytic domain-containing protein n=1 Tax=Paspalum notatum var. saurae TaxID=547442 RepID=A0AAQ3UHI6_PASNO
MAGDSPPPIDATSGAAVVDPGTIQDHDADATAAADLKRAEDLRAAKEDRERMAQVARDAALARAADADREAALAQQERDAADARLHAAQERAARERAAATHPQSEDDASSISATDDGVPDPLDAALLQHEAATLLNLHAQAVAVQNIRALVPLLLDTNSTFYARWRESFMLTLTKFSLERHILSDAVALDSPDWVRMNAVVRTWILGTISDDLADTVSQRGATARILWLSIESQFLGNRTTRALYADQEFRAFSQGDLPVAEYCRRYKKLAEDLRDLGEPVSDRTLVLNIIRGLNERFLALGLHLHRTNPLPSFLQVRDDLALEELTMAKAPPAAALAAVSGPGDTVGAKQPVSSTPAPRPPQQPSPRPPQQQQSGGGTGGSGGSTSGQSRWKRGKRGGRSANGGGDSGTGSIRPRARPWANPPFRATAATTPGQGLSTCGPANAPLLYRVRLLARPSNIKLLLLDRLGSGQASGASLQLLMGRHQATSAHLRLLQAGISKLSLPVFRPLHFNNRNNRSGILILDLPTRSEIVRCDSSGPLYPLRLPAVAIHTATLRHQRLGHPGHEAFSKLAQSSAISCNKSASDTICHACQLGHHVRLPFQTSSSRATHNFQLIHCDLWTSPVTSVSGHKYYLAILDDCSHYLWTFPLRLKSDTFSTLTNFFAYVRTQFGVTIQGVQCDNGREFDNSSARTFFLSHGIHLRMSCPYTSAQNGKAERIIRSINNVVRSLLFQASIPPSFWATALGTATSYLLNILPTKTLAFATPHFALLGKSPSYEHLRAFGCKCYPNLTATAPHKLSPRSALCVFLGYSPHHKGYLCLDRHTNRTIISRHVVFEETSFPFSEDSSPPTRAAFDFLDD